MLFWVIWAVFSRESYETDTYTMWENYSLWVCFYIKQMYVFNENYTLKVKMSERVKTSYEALEWRSHRHKYGPNGILQTAQKERAESEVCLSCRYLHIRMLTHPKSQVYIWSRILSRWTSDRVCDPKGNTFVFITEFVDLSGFAFTLPEYQPSFPW